jgi:hypothetical protein
LARKGNLANSEVLGAYAIFGPENTLNRRNSSFFKKPLFSDIYSFCVIVSLLMIDHEDFSVVVKNQASPPKSWRWEIYRAGRASAIDHSKVYFDSITEASRAGKAALKLMLSEYPD